MKLYSSCQTYNLVSCMDVTSGFIDNPTFLSVLDLLVASCKRKGYLLLKESLSIGEEQVSVVSSQDYNIAVYRNINDYKACFISRGCVLEEELDLVNISESARVEKMFLFRVR